MKQRQRFESWRQLLFSTLLLLAMGMTLTACSNDEDEQEQEVSYWDESYPEKIVEKLVDTPAYVTSELVPKSGEYTTILYSLNAESLDVAVNSNDYSGVGAICVETAKLTENKIPLHSKVYITASVTNRCRLNPDYAIKYYGFYDLGWANLPNKAYLHKIRIKK